MKKATKLDIKPSSTSILCVGESPHPAGIFLFAGIILLTPDGMFIPAGTLLPPTTKVLLPSPATGVLPLPPTNMLHHQQSHSLPSSGGYTTILHTHLTLTPYPSSPQHLKAPTALYCHSRHHALIYAHVQHPHPPLCPPPTQL